MEMTRVPLERFACLHCGRRFTETFDLFLHSFTDHHHKDIGLDKPESRKELANFKTRSLVVGGSVGVSAIN